LLLKVDPDKHYLDDLVNPVISTLVYILQKKVVV